MAFTASIANFAITLHAPTSTEMDTVHDALVALSDPWDSYTPTWTNSTTNPTIGNGTLSGAYIQVGKFVVFRVSIGMGSTTTFGTGAAHRRAAQLAAAGRVERGARPVDGWRDLERHVGVREPDGPDRVVERRVDGGHGRRGHRRPGVVHRPVHVRVR